MATTKHPGPKRSKGALKSLDMGKALAQKPYEKQLAALPRAPTDVWVIAGRVKGTCMKKLDALWEIVRGRAGLKDVCIHDLRHSFASRALALGESLPMIGKLLGHARVQTTARYARLARDTVKTAAAGIAASIGEDIFSSRRPGDAG